MMIYVNCTIYLACILYNIYIYIWCVFIHLLVLFVRNSWESAVVQILYDIRNIKTPSFISFLGTHEDSMYGTKLETIRSIHSEVWYTWFLRSKLWKLNSQTTMLDLIMILPFELNFLCILFQYFPIFVSAFQLYLFCCITVAHTWWKEFFLSADKKDDHATEGWK